MDYDEAKLFFENEEHKMGRWFLWPMVCISIGISLALQWWWVFWIAWVLFFLLLVFPEDKGEGMENKYEVVTKVLGSILLTLLAFFAQDMYFDIKKLNKNAATKTDIESLTKAHTKLVVALTPILRKQNVNPQDLLVKASAWQAVVGDDSADVVFLDQKSLADKVYFEVVAGKDLATIARQYAAKVQRLQKTDVVCSIVDFDHVLASSQEAKAAYLTDGKNRFAVIVSSASHLKK